MTAASELSLKQVTVRLADLQREAATMGVDQDLRHEAVGLAIVGFSKLEQSKENAEALGRFVQLILKSDDVADAIDEMVDHLEEN